jgi:hypothetical protein
MLIGALADAGATKFHVTVEHQHGAHIVKIIEQAGLPARVVRNALAVFQEEKSLSVGDCLAFELPGVDHRLLARQRRQRHGDGRARHFGPCRHPRLLTGVPITPAVRSWNSPRPERVARRAGAHLDGIAGLPAIDILAKDLLSPHSPGHLKAGLALHLFRHHDDEPSISGNRSCFGSELDLDTGSGGEESRQ